MTLCNYPPTKGKNALVIVKLRSWNLGKEVVWSYEIHLQEVVRLEVEKRWQKLLEDQRIFSDFLFVYFLDCRFFPQVIEGYFRFKWQIRFMLSNSQ